jgi:phosphate uptake regulator
MGHWSEKIANHVLTIEVHPHTIDESVLDMIKQISDNTSTITTNAMNSLFTSNIELANDVIDEYQTLQLMEEQLQQEILAQACSARARSENLASCAGSHLSFFVWAIRRIAELGSEIAELAITKTLSKESKLCYHAPSVQM